ncbi:RDD family protein [Chromobacterium sp. IIBBL 290-4]|uniref:RDD family protein n=1 Tax=Chromobacterium sp. IIBBL 290-4 TaxID=2953890 RepID=UPI0020B6BD0A|nr:RDD family protein [Chromobacterium sp. IIBBL 290-4]UTH75242.1 RDD family protein [Chromobacterium sp. IIBBL 290-4]
MIDSDDELEYVGFWARVAACLVDTVLLVVVSAPLLWLLTDGGASSFDNWTEIALGNSKTDHIADFMINYVLPAVAVILFWIYKSATPGKMMLGAIVVDADSGGPLTPGQAVLRYLGYYLSLIPFALGLIWVGLDARKQGWHDKLARTVVVRRKPAAVAFRRR